jgi:hypothetical protein
MWGPRLYLPRPPVVYTDGTRTRNLRCNTDAIPFRHHVYTVLLVQLFSRLTLLPYVLPLHYPCPSAQEGTRTPTLRYAPDQVDDELPWSLMLERELERIPTGCLCLWATRACVPGGGIEPPLCRIRFSLSFIFNVSPCGVRSPQTGFWPLYTACAVATTAVASSTACFVPCTGILPRCGRYALSVPIKPPAPRVLNSLLSCPRR